MSRIKFHDIIIGIIIILFILFIIYFLFSNSNLKELFKRSGFSLILPEDSKLTKYEKYKENNHTIKEITLRIPLNDIIRIKIIRYKTNKDAKDYMERRTSLIDSLFKDLISPYPGVLSNQIKCSKEFLPRISEEESNDYLKIFYNLYANKRLNFGICNNDLIHYKATINLILCKKTHQVFQIEYFTPYNKPNERYENIVKSFKCL